MKLFTKKQYNQLIENGRKQALAISNGETLDLKPIVKLFNPIGQGTWLLSEIDPDNPDIAFGLCDLGYPELGSVSLSELQNYRGPLGLGIERDKYFIAEKLVSEYAADALNSGYITA